MKRLYLPFVRLQIKFPVQLSHRDAFGVQDVSLDRLEGISARLGLALKGGHGVFQSFVTLKPEKVEFIGKRAKIWIKSGNRRLRTFSRDRVALLVAQRSFLMLKKALLSNNKNV